MRYIWVLVLVVGSVIAMEDGEYIFNEELLNEELLPFFDEKEWEGAIILSDNEEDEKKQEDLSKAIYVKRELTLEELKDENLKQINNLNDQINEQLKNIMQANKEYDNTSYFYFFERAKKNSLLLIINRSQEATKRLNYDQQVLFFDRQRLLKKEFETKRKLENNFILIDSYFQKNNQLDGYSELKKQLIETMQDDLKNELSTLKRLYIKIENVNLAISNIVNKGLVPYEEEINEKYFDDVERKANNIKEKLLQEKYDEINKLNEKIVTMRSEISNKLRKKELELNVSIYIDDLLKK